MISQTALDATTTTSRWLDGRLLEVVCIFAMITPLLATISHNQNVNERSPAMRLSDALIASLLALPGVLVCYALIVLLSIVL